LKGRIPELAGLVKPRGYFLKMELAQTGGFTGRMAAWTRGSDILVAAGVVAILVFMVIPLPAALLDLLLAFNITLALVILLVGMYILRPLELSAFPSILLLATLFRLSLNIASTRIILLHGHEGTAAAGKVIQSFGNFVVGGNYLVGIIVFLILVIINFVVITKGAGRIAEVAARFTLDAMPGKQMSIDADLNAGIIDEEEAKFRRELVSREAEYYGAMDGANKFVRGDAIAGIIITGINILGGLAVGVIQNELTFGEAAQNYTLLTVGDGLVTQIPALIISTSAGIIVSRAGSESSLGREITAQVLVQPKAIGIAAAVIFGFAMVPGLPTLPFVMLALTAAGFAYAVYRSGQSESEKIDEANRIEAPEESPDLPGPLPPLDLLALEVGYGLISMVDVAQRGELLGRIKTLRRQFAAELGILVAPIHIQDNIQLKPGEYKILLKGNEVGRGELMPQYLLAMDPGGAREKLEGVSTREPTYGLPALWIRESLREKAAGGGYTVVDPATVLTTHLSELIRRHAHELMGRQEVQQLLDNLKQTHPKVVEELVPGLLPLGAVVKVLQLLLKEQVPIRDLLAILETLADWAPMTKDPEVLTEYVRHALSRTITHKNLAENGRLVVLNLGPRLEASLAEARQQTDQGHYLALDPGLVETLVNRLAKQLEKFAPTGLRPVVICSAPLRLVFRKLVDRYIPDLVVVAYDEILPSTEVHSLGVVEIGDAD
jgi:flagellar biosynthesis protein FlhA